VVVPSYQSHPEPLACGGESDLALCDVVVEVRDAAGSVWAIELDRLCAERIRLAVPFRRLGSRRNQTHMPGWYWSATMAAHVGYESRLELACLLLADRNPGVVEIYSQPFRLVGTGTGGRRVRTVPDYLLVAADGSLRVVEVKPARRAAKPVVAARLAAMAEVLHRFGFGFQVFTEPDPVQLTNVRFLSGYRRSRMFRTAILDAVLACVDAPMSIATAESRLCQLWPRDVVRPHVLHLLWRGLLEADMLSVLDGQAMVWSPR
jgi:hypothetical protein